MTRSSVFEAIQIGVETTPGTAVAANRILEALGIGDPSPQGSYSPFRPEGSKFITLMRKGKEHTTLPYTMALDYANIVYVLSSLIGTVTPIQPDSVNAPNTYLWTFKPNIGADTPTTYTIEKGSSVRAAKFAYAVFNSLSLAVEANSEETDATGNILAQNIQDGITMTDSPSTVAAQPVLPEHWNVYLADSQSGLDTAMALDEVISFEVNYGEKFSPNFVIARTTTFKNVAEKYAEIGGTLTAEANSDTMANLSTLRGLTEKWIRFEAQGSLIEATYYYLLQIDMPIFFSALPSFGDNNDVYAANFAFLAKKDAILASALQIKVQNTLSAL